MGWERCFQQMALEKPKVLKIGKFTETEGRTDVTNSCQEGRVFAEEDEKIGGIDNGDCL